MVKRLFVGLFLGLVVGGLVAAGAWRLGLGPVVSGGQVVFLYLMASLTGVITGLVAGKPIWSKGGQIEAGLKAFVGALLGAGGLFAIRSWLHANVDLSFVAPGMTGAIGDLPAASLPLIAAILGGFYELDNTPDPEGGPKAMGAAGGHASGASNVRIASGGVMEEEEDVESAQKRSRH